MLYYNKDRYTTFEKEEYLAESGDKGSRMEYYQQAGNKALDTKAVEKVLEEIAYQDALEEAIRRSK